MFTLNIVGTKMRNALMAAIYRKCLRLSNSAMQSESTGKVSGRARAGWRSAEGLTQLQARPGRLHAWYSCRRQDTQPAGPQPTGPVASFAHRVPTSTSSRLPLCRLFYSNRW
jgi:hypothetical protein